jgi:hypothetical protein
MNSPLSAQFLPLHEKLYAGRLKIYAETWMLLTHALFQLVEIRKTTFKVCIFQGAKIMEIEVC